MAEPQRFRLARVAELAGRRQPVGHRLQLGRLALPSQDVLELVDAIEVILEDALAAAGDEDELFDAGGARLLERILNERPVDDRQHLLGQGFGGGQHARAQPGDGKYGLANHGSPSIDADGRRFPRCLTPAGAAHL